MTLKLYVSVQNWDDETDSYERISDWGLNKNQQRILHSILRQLSEHPETKFSSKLTKLSLGDAK